MRPVDSRLVLLEPGFLGHEGVQVLVLHAGDGFDAAGDVHLALAGGDALRGERDGLQARRAVAIHRHAGGGDRTSGAQRDLPRDVEAGGALGIGAAHEHVFDRRRDRAARARIAALTT